MIIDYDLELSAHRFAVLGIDREWALGKVSGRKVFGYFMPSLDFSKPRQALQTVRNMRAKAEVAGHL